MISSGFVGTGCIWNTRGTEGGEGMETPLTMLGITNDKIAKIGMDILDIL